MEFKEYFKWLLMFIVTILVLSIGGNVLGLWQLEFFGTKFENAKRNIFEESKSHVHGTIQNLNRLRLEYKVAESEAHRMALKEMILTEVSAFDMDKLPNDLHRFINTLGVN